MYGFISFGGRKLRRACDETHKSGRMWVNHRDRCTQNYADVPMLEADRGVIPTETIKFAMIFAALSLRTRVERTKKFRTKIVRLLAVQIACH